MNPHTGQFLSEADLAELAKIAPEEAAAFSVRLEGSREDVQRISDGIGRDAKRVAKNRARNRAARKARRRG